MSDTVQVVGVESHKDQLMRGQSVTAGTANQVAIDPTARAATAAAAAATAVAVISSTLEV